METLSSEERNALLDALDDEHKARATYEQVINDFGPVRPFVRIVESEIRHIDALVDLLNRYGIPVPENEWTSKVTHYPNVKAACEAAVQAEKENTALFDRLVASTTRPDILAVYERLQSASHDRHLPAFQRCASRSGEQGRRRERHRRGHPAH